MESYIKLLGNTVLDLHVMQVMTSTAGVESGITVCSQGLYNSMAVSILSGARLTMLPKVQSRTTAQLATACYSLLLL